MALVLGGDQQIRQGQDEDDYGDVSGQFRVPFVEGLHSLGRRGRERVEEFRREVGEDALLPSRDDSLLHLDRNDRGFVGELVVEQDLVDAVVLDMAQHVVVGVFGGERQFVTAVLARDPDPGHAGRSSRYVENGLGLNQATHIRFLVLRGKRPYQSAE